MENWLINKYDDIYIYWNGTNFYYKRNIPAKNVRKSAHQAAPVNILSEIKQQSHYRSNMFIACLCFAFVFYSTQHTNAHTHTTIKNHHHYLNKVEQVVASTAREEK